MAGVPREGVSNHLSLPGGPYNSTEEGKEISYSSYLGLNLFRSLIGNYQTHLD